MSARQPKSGGLLDREWVFWMLATVATAAGAAVRLHGFGGPSFWVDEFFTIGRTGVEPLHYAQLVGYLPSWITLSLHGAELSAVSLSNISEWRALGVTEEAARLGPCLVGIATIPVLAWLARPVAGCAVAGASAVLLALSPWHIYWSQMARFYSLQFLFTAIFVLCFARAMQTGRRSQFVATAIAGVLALLAHPTTILVIGACSAPLALAWATRTPLPHLWRGAGMLVLLVAVFAAIAVSREFELLVHGEGAAAESAPVAAAQRPVDASEESESWLGDKVDQSWGPSLPGLVLTTVQRIEPVLFVAGIAAAFSGLRRRDPFALLAAAVAVLVPAGALALVVIFPVAPRYYFPSLIGWVLLAAIWAQQVDRTVGAAGTRWLGSSGLAVLTAAVAFSTFLYVWDGSGARARWRDAFAFVERHADPGDQVLRKGSGRFQAEYYLGRSLRGVGALGDPNSLAPGTWVVQRTRGREEPLAVSGLEARARFEIPSKPWSWVLHVLRVPHSPRHSERSGSGQRP